MTKKIKFPIVLDISGWKGTINWTEVHPCPDLVICQASNGVYEQDSLLPIYWNQLKRMGIKRGAYHVFDAEMDSPAQINNYFKAIEGAGGFDHDCIPPVLDASSMNLSAKTDKLNKRLEFFLEEMQRYSGQIPIIQISRLQWSKLKDKKGNLPSWANKYLLWMVWYPPDPEIYKRPPTNTLPNGWGDWAIWKYDEAGNLPGIKGYIGLSTLSEAYAKQIGLSPEFCEKTRIVEGKVFKVEGEIIASEGVIIRRQSEINSKMLAFLAKGSRLTGDSIEFVNTNEAWLQVTNPVHGWCPIVHTGRVYLSINNHKR